MPVLFLAPKVAPRVLFIKAIKRGDDRTMDWLSSPSQLHTEVRTRKDGVSQIYHVGNREPVKAKPVAKPVAKPEVKPQEYRYALANRPFGIGTAPKDGWVRTEPRPAEGEDHHGLARHGFAIYSRPLTDKETSSFELTPIVTVDEHAKRLVAKMGEYAQQYAEPENAELLAEFVTQNARSVGVASTDDMTALQQRVLAQIGKAEPSKTEAPPFIPTHELPDGTPVRATGEKGVYTDASGAEIEDDYAKPIKAARQEPVKPAADKPKQEGHSRAPAGGGLGANGEWYEGGKFINTVPENAKGKAKANKATGKQEIEPRVWAVAPEEGMRSIWARWGSIWGKDRDGKLYVRQDLSSEYALPHVLELAQQDLDRYNAGERWYRPEAKEAPRPVEEAPKPTPQLSSWDRENLVTWVVDGKPTLFLHQKSKDLWDTLSLAVQDSIERSAERKRQDNAAIAQQATDNANREEALYQSVKTKLLAGNELTDAEIEGLGLRVKGAAFAYLSPTVQRLFGISKMKVREAMGDALKPSYSDFGAKTWVADPRKALANAAAWVNKANGPQEGDTKSENGANYVLRDGRWHRVEQQHEASKDGPDSPAESATTGTTGSQTRDQAPAGGAVSFDVLKGKYSTGAIAALGRRAQENRWPESFVFNLTQGLASLPQEIRDYFDHQAAMGNDVLIKHIASLDEIPGEFRESYRNAAAMTVNGMRIEFIEDRFPSINSLRHELVHYAWANLYGSDQRPGAGRSVVDEVLADVAADGEKILKWATSKATTKNAYEQIEADSLTKKLRRFTRDQKAGKDISSILKSSVELELMVGGYIDAAKAVLPTADAEGQYATVAVYMAIAKRLGVTMSGEFAKEEGVAYRCGEDEATAKKVFGSVAKANERKLIEKNEPKIHIVVPELGNLSSQVAKLQRGINFYTDPEGSQQKQAEIRAIQEGPLKKLHAQYADALRAYAAQHPGWYDTSGERPWLRQTKEEAPKPTAAAPKSESTGPQEGDTKTENGISYVLKDGRWHRTTAEVTGLRYDPATNRHGGQKLVRGDVLQGADGQRYTLDRDMGFSLQVDALGPDGRIVPASTRTISVDPSDQDRFLEVSLTGENLFEQKDGEVVDAKAKSDQHRQAVTDTLTSAHGWKPTAGGYLEKTFENVRPLGQAGITAGTWQVQVKGVFANILRGNDKQASIMLADNAKPADLADQIDQAVNAQVDKERVARGLKPEAKVPEAKAPVVPAKAPEPQANTPTDDLDPSSPSYRYRDTGYVGGSRKVIVFGTSQGRKAA